MTAPGLRLATPEDLPDLVAVEHRAHVHPWSEALLARELALETSVVLVATAGEAVIGHIVWWQIPGELQLQNVAVDPDHRRQGIGRALTERCVAEARSRGVAIHLEVRASNSAAIALYRDLGFQEVGLRPRYYAPDGEDAVLMRLDPTTPDPT